MKRFVRRAALTITLSMLAPIVNAGIIFVSKLEPEVPGATGTGFVQITYDNAAHTFVIEANWSGLSGTTTVAHIHCCTAQPGAGTIGVAVTPVTLPEFPTGLSAGSYVSPLIYLTNSASFTAGFLNNFGGASVSGAENALIGGIGSGLAYFNIHTTNFPGGEIRGFLHVPEPMTIALLGLGLAGLFGAHRRRN